MTRRQLPVSGFTKALVAFALLNLVVVNLVLILGLQAKLGGMSLGHTLAFLRAEQHLDDSWNAMISAYQFLKSGAMGSVYQEIFFEQRIKFQYPLSSLLIFPILERFSTDPQAWARYLTRFSWAFLACSVFWVVQIFRASASATVAPAAQSARDRWIQGAVVLGLALTYYPVVKAFSLGQIQVWLNALFALALLAFLKGRHASSGALCGLMCLIKPQYALFLIWGMLRKQVAFIKAFLGTILAGGGLTLVAFGPRHTLDYLRVTSFLARHGEAFYPNQSVNGLLNRLLFNGNNTEWLGHAFPPFHPAIYATTVATSVLLIVMALAWKNQASPRHQALDFCVLALVCTMASPIAWEHHYGVLLPIYAFALPLCLAPAGGWRRLAPWLAISFVLTSHVILATNRLADSWLNVAQSYLFFGACMLLGCLWTMRRKPMPDPESQISLNEGTRRLPLPG